MNERRSNPNVWEAITDFISGKGFYLVVLLCLVAIGVSGWLLLRSAQQLNEEPSAVAAAGSTQLPEVSVSPTAAPAPSAAAAATPSQAPAVSAKPEASTAPTAAPEPSPTPTSAPKPTPTPAPSSSPKPAALVFTWPANGPVIASFSVETLLYDETMLDWRVHEGIDIASEAGARVYAAASGTVAQVYDDDLMGTTVVVDHGNGLTSVYANLESQTAVSAGDDVFTGDIVGAVGATALAESGRSPHLHFAMYQDGEPVDPEGYLPE